MTYFIATKNGNNPIDAIETFKAFGEEFFCHVREEGYSVSHAGTGYGVPRSKAESASASVELAKLTLEEVGESTFLESLKKVKS